MKLETFFEKFDQFADAPNAVAKMRELVRHLALTGTLVEQDDNDEPALALLDKIAAHKAALAKDGKLRGPTTVSPMSPDEITRVLPSSWTWVRFGEIMVNRDGERIPVSKEERATKAKTYDYYGASGVIDKIDGYLFDKPLLLIGEDGANLINRSTPIAFMARGQYWVNNHAHVLDGISEDFLRYIELHINAINLEAYVTGSAQPKMNQAKMNSIPIALPPLAEQKRIVAKVDELMALCDRLEAQQQERETRHAALARASLARFADAPTPPNLNFLFHPSYAIPPADLRKSILTLAVQGKLVPQDPNDEPAEEVLARIAATKLRLQRSGEIGKEKPVEPLQSDNLPFEAPGSWRWAKLAELTELITKGSSPKWQGIAYVSESEGILFITSENVGNYVLRKLDDLKYVSKGFNEIEPRSILKRGDILMNLVGASIGRTAVYDLHDGANINQAVALIRLVRETDGVCPRFLLHYLNSPSAIDYMLSSRVVNAQPNISLTDAREFAVPIPPLAEQRRIVAKVEQLMALVDALETQLAASRATAANLLSALVSELTTKKGGDDEA